MNNLINLLSLIYIFFKYIFLYYYYYYIKQNKSARLIIIKGITNDLLDLNVNYLKIIQALCIQKNYLNDYEQEYLLKFTNNVPYSSHEIDYKLINYLKSKNVEFTYVTPINSGVSALVYEGKYDNKKVAIKILKKNAVLNMYKCLEVIEFLINIFSIIPYIKNLNLKQLFSINKNLMLEQLDFELETNNIIKFKNNFSDFDYITIPENYCISIDDNNDLLFSKNFIIMEFIDGFSIKQLLKLNNNILNEKFGEMILKFGLLSVLFTSSIHCDLHPGNFILKIFDKNKNKELSYKEIIDINDEKIDFSNNNYECFIGIIDFGLVFFPNEESQFIFYNYFNLNFVIKNFSDGSKYTLDNLIETIDKKESSTIKDYNIIANRIESLFEKYSDKDYDLEIFYKINKIMNNYNLKFKDDIIKIQLSLAVSSSMTKKLLTNNNLNNITKKLLSDFFSINNLISFD